MVVPKFIVVVVVVVIIIVYEMIGLKGMCTYGTQNALYTCIAHSSNESN